MTPIPLFFVDAQDTRSHMWASITSSFFQTFTCRRTADSQVVRRAYLLTYTWVNVMTGLCQMAPLSGTVVAGWSIR